MEREERTIERINRLAEERRELYHKASRTRLSDRELQRIDQLTRELDRLWEQYRQELAAEHRLVPEWMVEKGATWGARQQWIDVTS